MISESEADIIQNYYKPMLYVAQKVTRNVSSVYDLGGVEDVEFNTFVLRSTNALVTIGNILSEHAAVCNGIITQEQLEADTRDFENLKVRLEESLLGDSMGKIGLWNETMQVSGSDYESSGDLKVPPLLRSATMTQATTQSTQSIHLFEIYSRPLRKNFQAI